MTWGCLQGDLYGMEDPNPTLLRKLQFILQNGNSGPGSHASTNGHEELPGPSTVSRGEASLSSAITNHSDEQGFA